MTRLRLIACGCAALGSIDFDANFDCPSYGAVLKWLHRIAVVGDGPRRCITLAVARSVDLVRMMITNCRVPIEDGAPLFGFFSALLNDAVFDELLTRQVVKLYSEILDFHFKIARLPNSMADDAPLWSSRVMIRFCTHAFNGAKRMGVLEDLNWGKIVVDSLELVLTFCTAMTDARLFGHALVPTIMKHLTMVVHAGLELDKNTKEFLEAFSAFLARVEAARPVTREMNAKVDDVGLKDHIRYQFTRRLVALFSELMTGPDSTIPLGHLRTFLRDKLPKFDQGLGSPPLFERSVLLHGAQFDVALPLHLFAFFCRQTGSLRSACSSFPRVEVFFKEWALLPLRYHFAAELAHFAFVRNTGSILRCMERMKDGRKNRRAFLLTFTMIQTLLMEAKEKPDFLKMIAFIAGVFSDFSTLTPKEAHFIVFCFLHFTCCLIYDRSVRNNETLTMNRRTLIGHLILGPLKAADIAKILGAPILKDEAFLSDLSTYADRVATPTGTQFRLSSDADWHPLLPFERLSLVLQIMSKRASNPDLLKFPPLPRELSILLLSPVIFACEFHILSDPAIDKEAASFVFNLLTNTALLVPHRGQVNKSSAFTARTISELARIFATFTFRLFLRTPISYCGREPISMIGLISRSEAGEQTLKQLGEPIVERPRSAESRPHPRAAAMKDRIRQSFHDRQLAFTPPADLDSGECSICHDARDEFLVYPALIYGTFLPEFIANGCSRDHHCRRTAAVRICLHPVHPHCLPEREGRNFCCAIDRCHRNAVLPRIHGTDPIDDQAMVDCLESFLLAIGTNIGQVIDALAGQIETLEVRLRSNPCVDTSASAALLRNFYLAIWHGRREQIASLLEGDISLAPLASLIAFVLTSGDDAPVEILAESIASGLEPEVMLPFLRRAVLFDVFALHDGGQDVDVAPLLEPSKLAERFQMQVTIEEIQPFGLRQLPETLLGFLEPPFEIDIANNDEFEIAVCLLTEGYCVMPKRNITIRNTPVVTDFIEHRFGGTFGFFFLVTGERAGTVIVADLEFNRVVDMKSCYVDEFGEEDCGFSRGHILELSKERCAWLIDQILSGDWTDKLILIEA
jgi:hypothetical protein